MWRSIWEAAGGRGACAGTSCRACSGPSPVREGLADEPGWGRDARARLQQPLGTFFCGGGGGPVLGSNRRGRAGL